MIPDLIFEAAAREEIPSDKFRANLIRLAIQSCPQETRPARCDHAEIRSLVRLYRKSSPASSPVRQAKPVEVRKVQFVPTPAPPQPEAVSSTSKLRRFSHAEMRRPSIKFSTSTALYTPAKPSLGLSLKLERADTSFDLGRSHWIDFLFKVSIRSDQTNFTEQPIDQHLLQGGGPNLSSETGLSVRDIFRFIIEIKYNFTITFH